MIHSTFYFDDYSKIRLVFHIINNYPLNSDK